MERDGKRVTLRPKQLVLATGMSGYPKVPQLPGAETFLGEQHHSSQHSGPEAYRGKICVVIGSNTSAHDICAALWEHGADVTMVQRSSSLVARSETLFELSLYKYYSEDAVARGLDHETADLVLASMPYKLQPDLQKPIYREMAKRDADLYARLEKAGFLLDFGEDGSGLTMKYFAARLGLLHRCRRLGADRRRAHQAEKRPNGRASDGKWTRLERRQRACGRPDRLCHRLRPDETSSRPI